MFTGALVTGVSYTLIFAGLITTSVHGGLVQKNQRRFSQYNPAAQYGTRSSSINFWGQPPSIRENIERMKASVISPASQYRYVSTQYPYERRIDSMGPSLMDYTPDPIVNSGMDQYPIPEEEHLGAMTSRLQDSIVDYAKGAVEAGKNMMNNVVGRASQWLSLLGDDEVQEQRLPPQPKIRPEELTADYWLKGGVASLKENLFKQPIMKKAKNVILFLGDGMSIATVTASRIYSGQKQGEPGEDSELSFDYFPWTGLSRTYCVNSQVADSACSATAYLCGVKANKGTIGVTAAVNLNDCAAMLNTSNHVHSIVAWAQEAGKSTGVVTTTRVTHASPAGTYAHVANRMWESDKDVMESGSNPAQCMDIAKQLVLNEPGRNINVVLGGGLTNFLPNSSIIGSDRRQGKRKDQLNLIKTWLNDKKTRGLKHAFVSNRKGLQSIDRENTDYLLGLFSNTHIPYALNADREKYPTLAEMTEKAIDILSKNELGYVLFVEGGRIDHALHNNQARRALSETVEFSNAIQHAVDMTSVDDTLIVITSDHAHTMTLNGYPVRGQDVLGIAGYSEKDLLAYTTLSFANGPGYRENNIDGSRHDPEIDDLSAPDYRYPAMVPMQAETHGGEDVGIFSRGPWSHLFTGVMEQNVIPLTMGFAACIGPHKKLCREMRNE